MKVTVYAPEWCHSLPQDMKDRLLRGEPVVLGGAIYQVCAGCYTVIRVNKFLLGSAHLCREPEWKE